MAGVVEFNDVALDAGKFQPSGRPKLTKSVHEMVIGNDNVNNSYYKNKNNIAKVANDLGL